MAEPQFADELFPEETKFADDLFPSSVDTDNARQKLGASPMQDFLFSRDKASVARTLSHFGQGFKEAWGHEKLGLSDKSQKYLKESGWFNDYDNGQRSITKAANEALFRPAAVVLDAGWRTLGGAMRGAQEMIAGTGRDVGQPQLGRDLAAMPEAFMHARPVSGMTGMPQVRATVGGREILAHRPGQMVESGEALLARARAAKVIGHGEEGWRGTVEAKPTEMPFRGFIEAEDAAAFDRGSPVAPVESVRMIDEGTPGGFNVDVNAVARDIAPDVFTRYDELQGKRESFGGLFSELDNMQPKDAAQAKQIEALKAKAQEGLRAAETEAREMAPAVREAYVEAKRATPEDAPASVLPEESAAPAAMPGRPIEEQRAFIVNDVREKLIAAGRPATEAEAAAAIDAAYWETRAARFRGAKGSAEEMYRAEGPEILGPGMQSDFRKPRAPSSAPMSLGQFISRTGIKDNDPLIADVRSITGGRKYIRKDGVSLDTMREMAEEQGYIPRGSTINTLLEAMDDQERGNKVFKRGDAPEAAINRDEQIFRIEQAIDDALADAGMDPRRVSSEVHERAVKIMDKEGVRDPLEALERAGLSAEMFQDGDIKRGRIRLREDGQNTITLLKDANASTFIHEKGHDYLARMVRDANDPLAPVELRTDAETVYRWLGVEKPGDIKTSHHEKFARGFENYIMEGRAPSQGLARVFEQFRQWLLRIYTEASRLKAPINDEIRGVFDRMLAISPEDVVITPDRAPERMAGRHEAFADLSPAPASADTAGIVRAERDNMAGRLPLEEQDARLAEIAAGLEGRAARGPEPLRDVNAPEPVAERGGFDPQSGAVSEGGGPVASEAPQLAPEPSQPVKPTTPHSQLPPSTEIADKAGNIRLDLLNAPDDVKRIISQVAEENGGFQRVRGPVTDVQVAELAEAMGMDATYLSTRKMGEAWTAPQIVALRNLLIQSASDLRDVMKKAATGDEAALMAYAEAKTRHMMIQERVSSVTSEAGRALRAFRKDFSKGMGEALEVGDLIKKTTGQTLFQLQREAQLGSALETPSQISKYVHDSRKATVSEMVQETWINALLSGPITHVKNIIGNTTVAVLGTADTAGAAGVGKIRQLAGNKGERVKAGEVQANLFGLIQGAQDGIRAARYAFKHEEQYTRAQTLEQGKFQAVPSKRIVLKTYEQGSPEYNKRLDSIANARASAERLTGEAHTDRVKQLTANPTEDMVLEAKERAVEIGGKQIRTPGRLLTAEDEFFKTVAYRSKLNELAYREASKTLEPGTDAFNGKVAQLTMYPPEDLMTAASKHADYQTFTNALGKTGVGIQMFANSHLLAKMVVPFVRTPLNLLKYANERTPLGVFSREVRANLNGTNGKIAQDTQIARMAIGTSLGMTAIALADQGIITGGGPSDKNEKAALMLSGWRPYSVKIGDHYYSYGWLDPFATIMGISADMADAVKQLGGDADEEIGKVAANLFASISKNVLNKSSLRGTSDLLNAVSDPDRYGDKYLQNLAGTVIPASVAQQARANDEFQREARTVLDVLKSRIPGMRTGLLPKRDIWGEPIRAGESLGPDSLSPIVSGKLTKDPATKALIDAEFFPAKIGRKIRGVELTDQQYDDLSRVAGRMAKVRIDAIVSNPGFSNAPAEVRSEILKKAINGSREAARSMIMMQNPSIIREALENKMPAVGR
jgi:hypothetical protein